MKALLDQYASYNEWAHRHLLDLIRTLDEEKQHREIASSFSSLYKTVFHVWTAGTAWWQRLHEGQTMIKEDPFKGNFNDLADGLLSRDKDWSDWVLANKEEFFTKKVNYKNLKGAEFIEPRFQILLHIFNHSSYHNGQIVTIFHHLGVENIPATDFIVWCRENKFF